MKRILFACIAICFFACSPNREPETVLKLSTTDIVFSANEETQSFNVESNEAWAITQIPEWLNMDSNNGKGNRKVMVTAKANPSEQERSATLKISIKDKSVELKIRQLGKNVTLSLSKTEIMFPAEPGTESISFDITVNEAWTINNIPEWCTFSANKGNESTTVTITAEKNYIDTQRGAIVQVKAGSKTAELTLKQEALNIILQFSNMDLTASYPETIEVSAYSDAAMRQVMIRSNTKWGVNSGVEWVTLDKNSGIENESLTLNIAENRNKTDRSANVTISAGSKSIKIIVRQSRLEDVPSDNPYQINERDNAPHIGDELLKRQVEYVDPGSAGENITWDFSHLQFTNNDYQVTYTEPPFDGTTYIMGNSRFDINQTPPNSLIVCTQYYTMYYFQIKNNQLLEVGHENPATILDYNPKPAEEIYPSYYDTYYKSDYKSTYLYSATVPGATKGYKEIKADGYGTIVLPAGTYANTLRIKYVKTIQNVDVPGGGILLYPEQIQEYTIYKWYVKGYRYPVLETHREINLSDNSEVFSTAFYCPPAEQPNSKLGKTQAVISKPKNVKGTIKLSRKESILPILQLRFSSPPFDASRPQPEND